MLDDLPSDLRSRLDRWAVDAKAIDHDNPDSPVAVEVVDHDGPEGRLIVSFRGDIPEAMRRDFTDIIDAIHRAKGGSGLVVDRVEVEFGQGSGS